MFGSLKQGNICYILIKSEKPINSMYRMIPKSRMDEFKRFAAIFGFTEENIENILSKEKEMVGK